MSGKRYVNIVPQTKIKKEEEEYEENEVVIHCRLCSKEFASIMAICNHARIEHIEAFETGDPSVWTKEPITTRVKKVVNKDNEQDMIKIKTEELISTMEPTSIVSLASNDVSYILIKSEDMPTAKKKKVEKAEKKEKITLAKKERDPITGPFECMEATANGACWRMFLSCCEYSRHARDEHAPRRRAARCQVCEAPLCARPRHCETCGEGFDTNEELLDHMTTHVKVKPYQCSICYKRFTQQGGVLQHMRMHTGDRPFTCTYCPKAFTQKSGLDQHLRIHTKVRPYRCVICSKTFCQSVHLKQHMRTHTNVSPFQCGICEKRFKQSSHLTYHLKNHNPASLTEEQRQKYKELVGMMKKQVVQVVEQTGFQNELGLEQVIAEQNIKEEDKSYLLPAEAWDVGS